jgi:hypothetical protein
VPPDVTAGIFWLKNRDPARWRDAWKIDQTMFALGSPEAGGAPGVDPSAPSYVALCGGIDVTPDTPALPLETDKLKK